MHTDHANESNERLVSFRNRRDFIYGSKYNCSRAVVGDVKDSGGGEPTAPCTAGLCCGRCPPLLARLAAETRKHPSFTPLPAIRPEDCSVIHQVLADTRKETTRHAIRGGT